jgi:hypothetical protein
MEVTWTEHIDATTFDVNHTIDPGFNLIIEEAIL